MQILEGVFNVIGVCLYMVWFELYEYYYPSVVIVARTLSTSLNQSDQFVGYTENRIEPGYEYLNTKFDQDL